MSFTLTQKLLNVQNLISKSVLLIFLFLSGFALMGRGQAAFTSARSGNWDGGINPTTGTWTITSGSDADNIPDADDAVTIIAGHTITVNVNAGCASIVFSGSGTQTLTVNLDRTLTVTGNVAQNSGNSTTKTANIQGAGTLVCGSMNVGQNGSPSSSTETQTINSSIALLDCSGTLTIYSNQGGTFSSDKWNTTFNASAGKVKFSSIAMTAESNGSNLSSATFSLTNVLELTGGTNPWSFASAGTITVTIGASSTVIYSRLGDQTVLARTYNNLQLSGSGIKTIGSPTATPAATISGNLSISGTAVASLNAGSTYTIGSLTLGGYGKISGTWGSASASPSVTNQTNTFFAATTGRLSVTNDTRPSLTVTATAQSKDYGSTAPTSGTLGTNYTATGSFVGADAASGVTLSYSGSPAGNTATAPVNTYTITPSAFTVTGGAVEPSSALSNYNITYNTGTLTVNKKELTITAGDQTVNYGTSAATVTGAGTYTPTGFVNSETASVISGTVSYTTTYTAATNAGTAGVTITPVVTGLSATNYSFTAANGTITISKANSSITATGTTSFTFNGSAQGPASSSVTGSTGSVTYSYSGTGSTTYGPSATRPTNAGTYEVVATVAADANYNGASSSALAFTITSAAVTSVSWGGSSGGNWSTPGNWNEGVAPTSSMDVTISSGSPVMDMDFTIGSGKTLTISGSGSLTIAAGNTLTVTGTANFGGKSVTLRSNASATAAIGQITGTLSNATAVTVERYVQSRRKWRALTAPLVGSSTNSIYDNWQNGGSEAGSTGAMIWSPSASTGVYQGGGASSLLTYNSATNTWSEVTNTSSTNLFTSSTNNAYVIFLTGPYNSSGTYITSSSGSAATTLKATGTLRKGDVTMSNIAGLNQFVLVGNPFASAINLKSVTKSNYGNVAYVWDPSMSSLGGYQAVNMSSGTDAQNTVESGQAFFLQTTSATNSLTFKESDKVSSVSNLGNFRTSESNAGGQIIIDLNKYVNGSLNKYDNVTCDFVSGANAGLDGDDALKPTQFYENMSIYREGKDLSWETRPSISTGDELPLRMWAMQQANYQLKVSMKNIELPAGLTAVLQDQLLGTETVLNANGSTLIDFSVNANNTGTADRFRVVFRGSAITPVTDLNGEKGFSVYPNPLVKGGSAQIEFRNRVAGKYTVTLFTIAGVRVQQDILSHAGGTATQLLKLSSNLTSGTYIAEISGVNGVSEKVKVVVE